MIIDTHAHLMFPEFKKDLPEVIKRAKEAGIKAIINVGCCQKTSEESLKMADGQFIYATLGLHPYDAEKMTERLIKEWEETILKDKNEAKKIVAIGETGLDYFKAGTPREKQKKSFEEHIKLAIKTNLPIIIHNRNADNDCLEILKRYPEAKAVFHCFGSSLRFANELWKNGYYTSFTGIITYPQAQELREVIKECPMDLIFIETDAPYLSPQAYRGKRNEPAYLKELISLIAKIKNKEIKETEEKIAKNSIKFFNLNQVS